MKISKSKLKQIIKEEMEEILKEGGDSGGVSYAHLMQINGILREYGYALRQPLDAPLELINI